MKTSEKKYAVGTDVGGQSTVIGIVNTKTGKVIVSNSKSPIKTDDERYSDVNIFVDELCDVILSLIEKIDGGIDTIAGIGIGAPNANFNTESIENAPNLHKQWKIFPIVSKIKERISLPVFLDNDANLAALGEFLFGGAKGMKNVVMATLGTGLGGGIILDGKIMRGQGVLGEIGHMIVCRDKGRKCGCGRSGCLEAYCSAKGMARTAIEFLEVFKKDDDSILKHLYEQRKEKGLAKLKKEGYKKELLITSEDVYNAAMKGDKIALEIFNYTGKILGEGLTDIVAAFNPEIVILFGGLAKSGDLLLEPTKKSMEANLLNILKEKVDIKISKLNDNSNAAILGAAALAVEMLK